MKLRKGICGFLTCFTLCASPPAVAAVFLDGKVTVPRDLLLFQRNLGELERIDPIPVDLGDTFTFRFTQADGGDFVLPYIPRAFSLNLYTEKGGSGVTYTTDGTLYVKDAAGAVIRYASVTGFQSQLVSSTVFYDDEVRGANSLTFREFGGTVTFSNAIMRDGASGFPDKIFAFGYSITGSAIPEPSTYALLIVGLGMMGFVLRAKGTPLQRSKQGFGQ